MSLGTLGSTLNDELNRLANGGTYRDMDDMVDEALAAKQWANLENISPYSTDTVGVLNEIAGLGLDKKNWLDFNGVCNYIAGTSGLPAAAALRQIYPTTDLLTGVAAYYVDAIDASASGQTITNLGNAGSLLPTTVGSSTSADSNDPKFLAHTGTNYVYLPGVASNSIFTPSTVALQITGDIDVRVQAAMDDWTPATDMTLASKRTTGNISWELRLQTTGTLLFEWYSDGVTPTGSKSSTVATGVTDGAVKWIRATLDVNNGASGNDVKFFTSDNGTTWTQLGTTVTTAGVTSIFGGTANIEIGTRTSMLGGLSAGKFYRAQIYSDITETTKVLDVDTSVITAGSATSFTAVTGQTVTINRGTTGRKSVAVTQPTWLFGTDDYMEVNNRYMAHSGSNYMYLPGVTLNYASAPDSAALDITGDIDLRVKVALDDWTPSAQQVLLAKSNSVGNQRSYAFIVTTAGNLQLLTYTDGSTTLTNTSTVTAGITDGSTKWVRVTLDVDNGAVGNTATFFTSDDGITWTQLGSPVVNALTTSIFNSTSPVEIGSRSIGNIDIARGKFFRAQVLNGIGGTVAFDANFESSITSLLQTSFTESSTNAATVTINRSGSTYRSAGVIDAGYLYPGATNTFANSTIDYLNFGATDSFTALVVSRQANYTATQILMNKGLGLATSGYFLRNSTGVPATLAGGFNDPTIQVGLSGGSRTNLALVNASLVRNTTSDNGIIYTNATAGTAGTDTTTGSLATVTSLFIGSTGSIGNYADMELYAAAVFRTALTAAQIRQINNYFANREVYL
jgi:hypothetical protein